ncbi:nitrate/nitrite transporter [Rhizobium leguminosarum bv. trifolii WSM2297]|uniref:Nitrate/nitrite transporter n=1 Tax=Rhizobium leguminosarum bv. trifolii WSM2297 TaxID=754762 RepID=J0CWE5_RHILT|nr:MFS transporter [Rhizobium leguminosarum]EJC84240.1 nitrate/nitrite transporter [Rhizobium leguminosarum bv. trifolii WSM2297]
MRAVTMAFSAAFLASMYFRSYFSIVGPSLARDLMLDPAEFGWLVSAFFASFGVLQVPVGIAFDRWGVRWPTTLMMIVGAAGSALLACAHGFGSAAIGQTAIGIGCAPIFMGVLYFLGSALPPDRAGNSAAIVSSVGSFGALLSASPLSWFTATFGWRSACWSAAGVMLACAVAIALTVGEATSRGPRPVAKRKNMRWPMLMSYILPICFTLSLGGTFRNAWAGPYVTGVFGQNGNIGLILSAVSLFGIATSFLLPLMLLLISARVLILASFACGAICATLIAIAPDFSLVLATAALAFLYAIGNVHPLVMTEAQTLIPDHMRGVGLGALNTLVFLGVSASSSAFGEIANMSLPPVVSYQFIFALTAIALTGALFAYVMFRPPTVGRTSEETASKPTLE